MNEVWNLDVIYRGFDDPAFAADMEKLERLVQDYVAFAGELDRRRIDRNHPALCGNPWRGQHGGTSGVHPVRTPQIRVQGYGYADGDGV